MPFTCILRYNQLWEVWLYCISLSFALLLTFTFNLCLISLIFSMKTKISLKSEQLNFNGVSWINLWVTCIHGKGDDSCIDAIAFRVPSSKVSSLRPSLALLCIFSVVPSENPVSPLFFETPATFKVYLYARRASSSLFLGQKRWHREPWSNFTLGTLWIPRFRERSYTVRSFLKWKTAAKVGRGLRSSAPDAATLADRSFFFSTLLE